MQTASKNSESKRTARITAICYLLLAITGVLGFLIYHPQIFIPSDTAKTVENLMQKSTATQIRILLEMGIIVSQALTAVYFYKLFKKIDQWAAWSLGIWGSLNAMIILISAIAMASAFQIANLGYDESSKIMMVALFTSISTNAWAMGSLFFGLWLIPMCYIIISSKCMPFALGYTLILGGLGYILSIVMAYTGWAGSGTEYLTIPASIGEFWIIGYMLIFGIRTEVHRK